MKILLIGNSYFADKLTVDLCKYDSANRYNSPHTDGHFYGKLKYVFGLAGCDVVYSLGGEIYSSKAVDLALRLKKRVILHWIGSDVVNSLAKYRQGKVNRRYVEEVTHFCEAPWIQEELKEMGIVSEIVQIVAFDKDLDSLPRLPEKFSILSYVGKGSEKFYGIEWLVQLAKDFPDTAIKVAGISEYVEKLPSNVQLLGWVSDMETEYTNCVLYLRLPSHDGLAFSVIEALSAGRYVGYSQKFENTIHIDGYKTLKELVTNMKKTHTTKGLAYNLNGIAFVQSVYNREKVLGTLVDKLTKARNG